MNILLISAMYPPHVMGGAEIVLQRQAEGLKRRGLNVTVLCTGPQPGLHKEDVRGVTVYRAGLHNLYWPLSDQRPGALGRLGWHLRDRYNNGMRAYVGEVLAAEGIDLAVCHNLCGWSISVWDEITAASVPQVQVLHDLYLMCPSGSMFKKTSACTTPCTMCRNLRSSHGVRSGQLDAVVGVSQYIVDSHVNAGYFQGVPTHVIYNASPRSGGSAPAVQAGRSQASEPLRFGFIGQLSPHKGLEWLIDQFQRLPFNATLQIAGRGQADYEKQLRRQAKSDAIHFVGFQSPEAFYRQIDVVLVPSLWNESFGMVAVEACAHSVPVIASRRGGLPEIVQDEVNGLLCDPDEPDSLGLAMLRLFRQPSLRLEMARRACASVSHLLDMDRMLDSYHQLFTHVLARKGAHHVADPVVQSF